MPVSMASLPVWEEYFLMVNFLETNQDLSFFLRDDGVIYSFY